MLDINRIHKEPEQVKRALLKRMTKQELGDSLEKIIGLDERRRSLINRADELKTRRNKVSRQIPLMRKKGEDSGPLLEEMKTVSRWIGALDKEIALICRDRDDLLIALPNLPAETVPAGGKKNNSIIRRSGNKPDFAFEPRDHMELAASLNLVDYPRGVKLGGAGHWLYRGRGALLEWALLNYFTEEHVRDGYEFILPPHTLNRECGYTAGQFPKFDEDVYYLEGDKKRFLLPTAETALVNIHRDEVVEENQLPLRYFAYTPCYRKEAGSYRSEERGMIRGHQFNKVEMFQYTRSGQTGKALEELIGKVEKLMEGLELHYQVSRLAAGDCSAAMEETVDIEVWIPSMGLYKEVSSASSAGDYQARRGNIKYKNRETGKNEYLHTLNASGLATSRLVPAILEQHQRADGRVRLPEVLQNRLGLGEFL